MTAGRKLAPFFSLVAICWFASSSLIAQDKEQKPETEQAKKEADEKDKKEEDVRPEGLSESVTVTPIISLRGVRSTNETELGDPAVGVHLDGIYSPRMQGILAMTFDNERVEVLRGPQGTLFGRNSTVGSINIVSNKPKFDRFDASLFLQYGNYNAPELRYTDDRREPWSMFHAGLRFYLGDWMAGYWPTTSRTRSSSTISDLGG